VYRVCFPGINLLVHRLRFLTCGLEHRPPFSAEVKKSVELPFWGFTAYLSKITFTSDEYKAVIGKIVEMFC
jgi:hypothetical protein